jgi:hypothetical protein
MSQYRGSDARNVAMRLAGIEEEGSSIDRWLLNMMCIFILIDVDVAALLSYIYIFSIRLQYIFSAGLY